jgi:hypothetical protein
VVVATGHRNVTELGFFLGHQGRRRWRVVVVGTRHGDLKEVRFLLRRQCCEGVTIGAGPRATARVGVDGW